MKNDKNYNVQISCLKIWMVMSIVISHFLDVESSKLSFLFTLYGNVGVPVLFLLSFYLNDFTQKKLIIKRMERLITPHLFFSLLYFMVYGMLINPPSDVYAGGDILSNLLFQICFGVSLNPPMWFLPNLIVISLFFYMVFIFFETQRGIWVSIVVAGVALWLQYSGVNFFYFHDLPDYAKWTVGRFVELVPFAVLGVVFSYYNLLECISRYRKIVGIVSVIILLLEYKFDMVVWIEGFGYQGIYFLIISICLVMLFCAMPLEKMPMMVKQIINKWSCYNMGIIAIHYMVRAVYGIILGEVRRLSLDEALLLYVVSLLISIVGTKIPIKFIKSSFT